MSYPICETPYPHCDAENLLHQAFGAHYRNRDVYQLRTQNPTPDLCHIIIVEEKLIALLRYWQIQLDSNIITPILGVKRWLLLGPLAVARNKANQGYGTKLIKHTLAQAEQRNYDAVFVSGVPDYYYRFGFALAPQIYSPQNTPPHQWLVKFFKNNNNNAQTFLKLPKNSLRLLANSRQS